MCIITHRSLWLKVEQVDWSEYSCKSLSTCFYLGGKCSALRVPDKSHSESINTLRTEDHSSLSLSLIRSSLPPLGAPLLCEVSQRSKLLKQTPQTIFFVFFLPPAHPPGWAGVVCTGRNQIPILRLQNVKNKDKNAAWTDFFSGLNFN